MKKRILFISPNFARTGSEMVLWYLLANLNKEQFTPYLFCLNKGELFEMLPSTVNKSISYKGSGSSIRKIWRGFLKMMGIEPIGYQLAKIQQSFKADFWYVNTILIPEAHVKAKELGVPIVTHFHEFTYAYSFISAKSFQHIINNSKTIVACSRLVENKIKELGHPDIRVQESFIDIKLINPNADRIAELRSQLAIKPNDFVWIISGTMAYMKGLDLVLDILSHFKDQAVKIIWIGGAFPNGLSFYVKEVALRNYNHQLIFTGAVANDYYNYFSLGNGYLSLSREECLSLAMLEAAYLGIPIVSFNTGIVNDFVKPGMGKVVNSWNMSDMIEAMEYLHKNPAQDSAMLKEAAMDFSVGRQLPKFEELLKIL